jgi:hypothetical protein
VGEDRENRKITRIIESRVTREVEDKSNILLKQIGACQVGYKGKRENVSRQWDPHAERHGDERV